MSTVENDVIVSRNISWGWVYYNILYRDEEVQALPVRKNDVHSSTGINHPNYDYLIYQGAVVANFIITMSTNSYLPKCCSYFVDQFQQVQMFLSMLFQNVFY